MRLSVRLNAFLVASIALVSLAFAIYQVESERFGLTRDLERNSLELAESFEKSAAPPLINHSYRELQRLVGTFRDHQQLAGVAIYDAQNRAVAVTSNLASSLNGTPGAVLRAAEQNGGVSDYFHLGERPMHVFALPIRNDAGIVGTVAIFHDTGYIDVQVADVWRRALASVVVQTLLIVCVTLLVLRWGLGAPIARLTNRLRDLRTGSTFAGPELPQEDVFRPLAHEVARLATTLSAARAAAETEAHLRNTAESLWTPERLRVFVRSKLNGSRLVALSNREPYEHFRRPSGIECSVPASGLVTALEPILRACAGTWIAQGTGDADAETVDEHDRLAVPPDHPEYTLRRVWLSREEEDGFYFGFANEGLWPLCHIAHTRPIFRAQDWEEYYA